MNVLVVAPHHDDEVIGCGGSIALHADRGDSVTVVYVTQGWSGIPSIPDRDTAIEHIRAEADEASRILGVKQTIECDAVDRDFGPNSQPVVRRLIQACRSVAPAVIYMPHEHDGDQEHSLVHALMRQVVWQASGPYFPELGKPILAPDFIFGYEVWRPMATYQTTVDISAVSERKIRALQCYRSQMVGRDWVSAVLGLASYRGVTGGVGKHVEVFQVIRCRSALSPST